MKTSLMKFVCVASFFVPNAVFAQDPSLSDLTGALGRASNSSRAVVVEEDENFSEGSDSDETKDEEENAPFAFGLNSETGEYAKNEPFAMAVKANTDGFLYLFNITPEGARLIFPNSLNVQYSLRAGEVRQFPDRFSGFKWRFSGEFQAEKLVVALSKVELDDEVMGVICSEYAKKLNNYSDRNAKSFVFNYKTKQFKFFNDKKEGMKEGKKWIEFDVEDECSIWCGQAILKLKETSN